MDVYLFRQDHPAQQTFVSSLTYPATMAAVFSEPTIQWNPNPDSESD
ncbi:hypothetical protein [Desulfosporosinus sp. Sb-LF]|nr:hypothetical protein [Desulfosporosinus sp. Sb-LF]